MTTSVVDDPDVLAADLPAFRAALRGRLADSGDLDPWRHRYYPTVEDRVADHARLIATLHEEGWTRYGWMPQHGGLGGDARHRAVFYDELNATDLPVPDPLFLLETLGSPVQHFAPHLATKHLAGVLSGKTLWGQGFSEPEAGSDLASVRCRARRTGDTYVISGSKLWTTHGAIATHYVGLFRTGTPESRHAGLTMIMVDASAPGISRRPIALASGMNEVAEVFYDDVVVPVEQAVGPENGGWGVAMFLLQYERAMYAWMMSATLLRLYRKLRDEVGLRSCLPPDAERRLAEVYHHIVTLRSQSADTVRRLASGQTVGPEASVDKVLLAAAETGLGDLSRELYGAEFLLGGDTEIQEWRDEWWQSRTATILGGSAEVQRTILADHVLHLPKEPRA